jgi:DNA-binding NarL/FixJ family response regulator
VSSSYGMLFCTVTLKKSVSFFLYSKKVKLCLNKCIVICKNCHKIEHSDIEFFEKYKDEIIKKSENLREVQSKINRTDVANLYKSGMTQKNISKQLNAHKSTISAIIKELNLK